MNTGEKRQVNLSMPIDLIEDLRTLADDEGKKLPTFVVGIAEAAVERWLVETGPEAFMGNLRAEHQAEEARYQDRFDNLRARGLL